MPLYCERTGGPSPNGSHCDCLKNLLRKWIGPSLLVAGILIIAGTAAWYFYKSAPDLFAEGSSFGVILITSLLLVSLAVGNLLNDEASIMNEYEVVIIQIRFGQDGLYTATSPDLSGVCIVHRNKDRIVEDMPNIVRHWYKRNRGIEVTPFWGPSTDSDGLSSIPMCTVRAEIAAQRLGR